jgi:hypothetical protein
MIPCPVCHKLFNSNDAAVRVTNEETDVLYHKACVPVEFRR